MTARTKRNNRWLWLGAATFLLAACTSDDGRPSVTTSGAASADCGLAAGSLKQLAVQADGPGLTIESTMGKTGVTQDWIWSPSGVLEMHSAGAQSRVITLARPTGGAQITQLTAGYAGAGAGVEVTDGKRAVLHLLDQRAA